MAHGVSVQLSLEITFDVEPFIHCQKKFSKRKWKGTTELFVLTDGEDQHNTVEAARTKLGKPGIANFHATLLSVDISRAGQSALDKMANVAKHVKTMSVGKSGKGIRKAYNTVMSTMVKRTMIVTTTTIVKGTGQ